jgi:ribosomal protein L40E
MRSNTLTAMPPEGGRSLVAPNDAEPAETYSNRRTRGERAVNDPIGNFAPLARASSDLPAERICLRCNAAFPSEGYGDRICRRCKSSLAWKNAVPTADNRGRQR